MIAESIQRNIDALRILLARNNGDLEHMAPLHLDALEDEAERVAGLEGAAVLNFEEPKQGETHEQPQES